MQIEVQNLDALEFSADVLAVKFAQSLYGVDQAVVKRLFSNYEDVRVKIPKDETQLILTNGKLGATAALFVGVESLYSFDYEQMRLFSYRILEKLSQYPQYKHLGITVHGAGYGLDTTHSMLFELAGFQDAIKEKSFSIHIEKITILELQMSRFLQLQEVLDKILTNGKLSISECLKIESFDRP